MDETRIFRGKWPEKVGGGVYLGDCADLFYNSSSFISSG